MNLRLPECASLCLVSVFLVTAACSEGSPTAPGVPDTRAKITAEPDAIVPEFHSGASCPQRFAPFGGRLTLVFHSQHDFTLRGLRFEFVDAFGGRAAPRVSSASAPSVSASFGSRGSTSVPIPSSPTIPFPSSPSIPLPTPSSGTMGLEPNPTRVSIPFDPVLVPAGTRALPLFLQFGCGVPATGILFIDVEIGGSGALEARRLEVPVKE